jgi:hypothetical protein
MTQGGLLECEKAQRISPQLSVLFEQNFFLLSTLPPYPFRTCCGWRDHSRAALGVDQVSPLTPLNQGSNDTTNVCITLGLLLAHYLSRRQATQRGLALEFSVNNIAYLHS